MYRCTLCQSVLPPGSAFCSQCGLGRGVAGAPGQSDMFPRAVSPVLRAASATTTTERVVLGAVALVVALVAGLWALNQATQGPLFCWDNSYPFKVGQSIKVQGETVRIESMTYDEATSYHACGRHPGLLQR